MDFRFNILILLLFLIIGITFGQDMYDHTRKYCGSHLAQALSTICKGNYNTIHKKGQVFRKRAYWDMQDDSPSSSDILGYPFQQRSDANAVVGSYKRRKRFGHGVYNECCEKSCSPDELSSYCAAPYRRRR